MARFRVKEGRHVTSDPDSAPNQAGIPSGDKVYTVGETFGCSDAEAETLRKDPAKFEEIDEGAG